MSYDILFVPRRPGQPWEQALDEAEARDDLAVPVGPERLQQWERIVDVLRRRTGEVEVAVDDEALEATSGAGLQVSLFPDEAALSFPYAERQDQVAFHDLVVDLVGLIEGETGLSAWDAQTDEPFDGRVHDEQGVAAARQLGRQARDGSGSDSDAPPDQDRSGDAGPGTGPAAAPPGAAAAPGSSAATAAPHGTAGAAAVLPDSAHQLAELRRKAVRYLVLGSLIVVVSLLLRSQDDPSVLSGLALAVGVADLVIGAFMYRSYQRRSAAGR